MRNHGRLTSLFLIAPALLVSACDDDGGTAERNSSQETPDRSALTSADDGQWLSLTGRIVSTSPEAFVLDYGAGNVTVEMDDWDRFPEGLLLKAGDEVTVSGLADEDLLMRKRIEARSVFVRNLNSIFFASNADEETARARAAFGAGVAHPADLSGVVTAVEGREFTLGTGTGAVRVDTTALPENPLDNQGVQRVKVGDRVFAWGDIQLEPPEGAELKARGLISVVPVTAAVVPSTGGTAASAGNAATTSTAADNTTG